MELMHRSQNKSLFEKLMLKEDGNCEDTAFEDKLEKKVLLKTQKSDGDPDPEVN